MDKILYGNVDLYEEFGVSPTALQAQIQRRFRQLALEYHPDKNSSPGAAAKFHYYSAINTALSSDDLRADYDRIRKAKTNHFGQLSHSGLLDNRKNLDNLGHLKDIERFTKNLEARERDLRNKHQTNHFLKNLPRKIEQLRLAGQALRRKYHVRNDPQHILYEKLPPSNSFDDFLQPRVIRVRWKKRKETSAQIDQERLNRIMSMFGSVLETRILFNNDENYGLGLVEYTDLESALHATKHDYRKSAELWDGTPDRKVASLLREAELWGFSLDGDNIIEEALSKQSRS